MDTIKRLIIKDLLALKSYKRLITMVFGMAIVFTFLGFYDKQMAMVTYTGLALPISILGGLANTILYEEEKANSDAFILTFPVNRRDIVLGKYLLNITLLLIGILFVLILGTICKLILPLNIGTTFLISSTFTCATNLLFIMKTPLVYKYGTEKANNIFMIILFAILSVAPVILLSIKSIDPKFETTTEILSSFIPYLPIIIILVMILLNLISFNISYKIYLKKEF